MKALSTIRRSATIEWALLIIGLVYSLTQLALSWNKPILDQYAFRQAQTAISAYWMMNGGDWLAYQTPVLGAPWPVPFEFPLYQWVVAILVVTLDFLTLDQSGRVASAAFMLACLWPLRRIASHYLHGDTLFRISVILILFSPLYVFWSRSFMIESTALFFSMWFLAALIDFNNNATELGFLELSATGVLAACIKITTFVGFSFAGALFMLYTIYTERKELPSVRLLTRYALILASVFISLTALMAWLSFSDSLKSQNPFGSLFTAEALKSWNFGTLSQRLSPEVWRVVVDRGPSEAIGTWVTPLICSLYAVIRFRNGWLVAYFSLLLLYLLPFMAFTNLHLVHHYYQYANSIFLICAIALVLTNVTNQRPMIGITLLALIISFEVYGYSKYFYDDQMQPNRELQLLLANYVRTNVAPDQVVIGFGLSWSSEVPYYAERRALFVPDSAPSTTLSELSADISKYTGGLPVGAVIVCPNHLANDSSTKITFEKLVSRVTKDMRPKTVGYCKVYAGSVMTQ